MARRCLLYYITDRRAFPGDEAGRRQRLLKKIAEAAHAGVDYIQLREKDLSTRELEWMAREALRVVRGSRHPEHSPALLINSRTDIAMATGAHGVHLRADDISPSDVSAIWKSATELGRKQSTPLVGVSCHSVEEVAKAGSSGATFAVFAPVFEKKNAPEVQARGLQVLQKACQQKIPVLALGGVTLENCGLCLDAGASGIAAIRLFQENAVAEIVSKLRS